MFTAIPGLPRRIDFAPVLYHPIGDYYKLSEPTDIGNYRQQEIEGLAKIIRSMPALPFGEAREQEMLRLTQYYEAFATLFGIDLREVARTRTQITATVMYTSPLLMQAMFDDQGNEDARGLTFFESRIQAGGFSFNATSINIIEGYPMSFSVLKRTLYDAGGEYEIDYPAVSLPGEAFWRLKQWHDLAFSDEPFKANPILAHIADAFSYRIHDWIHQAILYDTASATRIFQKWSDDSYFVKHFFSDPSMINYEFMSDKIHFLVWQQIFNEQAGAREILLANTEHFLNELDAFEHWLATNSNDLAAGKLANFLGYVGLRSLFNIIPIKTLKMTLEARPRFATIFNLLPEKYVGYLAKLYEPIDQLFIPFRKGQTTSISLQQILDEYVTSLREEFQTQKLMSISSELWKFGTQNKLQGLLSILPESVIVKLDQQADLRLLDPRVLLLLNQLIERLRQVLNAESLESILSRIELDPSGHFYLIVNQDEVATTPGNFVTAPYWKEAILVQIPWEYETPITVTVTRSQNVLVSQVGASEQVLPGAILLINVENKHLAEDLLSTLQTPDAIIAFDIFWQKLKAEQARGHIALGDTYPYEFKKALEVFDVVPENISADAHGNTILKPGYYQTKPAERRVARLPGPISMNSGNGTSRRRVLRGCVAENHILYDDPDLFPVDTISFDKFYQVDRSSVPILSFSSAFASDLKVDDIEKGNLAALTVLEFLALINDAIIHGFRGKPQPLKLRSLFEQDPTK